MNLNSWNRRGVTLLLMLLICLSAIAQNGSNSSFKDKAMEQYLQKDFLESIVNFQRAIAVSKHDSDSYKYLSLSYDSIGNYQAAQRVRERFGWSKEDTKMAPAPPIQKTDNEDFVSKVNDIIAEMERADTTPKTHRIINTFETGNYFYDIGLYDSAANYYRQYLYKVPRDTQAQVLLANTYFYQKKFDKAIDLYEAYLQKNEKNAAVYNYLGVCYMMNKNFLKARDYFRQCILFNENYGIAYYNLARVHHGLEDYGLAVKNLLIANEKMPRDKDVLGLLAKIYIETKDYNRAKPIFETLATVDTKSEVVQYNLATIYADNKEYDKAAQCLEKAIKLNPRNGDSYKKLGMIYFQKESYMEAMNTFELAAALKQEDKEVFLYAGSSANKAKQFDKAVANLQQATALDSQNAQAYYELGIAYKGLKKRKLSRNNFKTAQVLDPRIMLP